MFFFDKRICMKVMKKFKFFFLYKIVQLFQKINRWSFVVFNVVYIFIAKFVVKVFWCRFFFRKVIWALGFFRKRIVYGMKLWLIELRLLYIFRIFFLLIVLYLPPMSEIDVVWWFFTNVFDIFVFFYSLFFFIYFVIIKLVYFLTSIVTSSFFFCPWFIELWDFFATYWVIRYLVYKRFYYIFFKKRIKYYFYFLKKSIQKWSELDMILHEAWLLYRAKKAGLFNRKIKLMKGFIKAGSGPRLRGRIRGMYRYGQWHRVRRIGGYYRFFFKQLDLHFYVLVGSMWFVLFVYNIYAFIIILAKFCYYWIIIPSIKFVSWFFVYLFWQFVNILDIYIWPLFCYLIVLCTGSLLGLFSDWFMYAYNNLLGIFFVFYELIGALRVDFFEYLDILFNFFFSINFFLFFWHGFVYLVEYVFFKFYDLFCFLFWVFKLLDSFLIHFSVYVWIQILLLKCYVYIANIVIIIGTEIVYVGLLSYHVILFTVMHCLDYIDFSNYQIGTGVWFDFYFIILASWFLDFEFRWYSRAIVKPSPLVYEEIIKKSVFLPKALQQGPVRIQFYIQQYLKNASENPERYMYSKPSKYFRWYIDDYEKLLDIAWIYAQGQIYSTMVDSRDCNSMKFTDWNDLKNLDRVYDFENFYKPFERATSLYAYGGKEFEDVDLNYDIEELMEWYIEWYAYETGTYNDAEMFKYIENYSPVIPTVEVLAIGFQTMSLPMADFGDLDYYYDSYFYPYHPRIVFVDESDVHYVYTSEHISNVDCAVTFNDLLIYFWVIPLIWAFMFWFGWGSTMYYIEGMFEEGAYEFQFSNFVTFAFSASWLDWLFNWHFLDFFPFLRGIIEEARFYSRHWRWRIWACRRFWSRRYNRAQQARQLISLKFEYPWLSRFYPEHLSRRWYKIWYLRHNTGVMKLKHKKYFKRPRKFYNWSDLAELDMFVYFFSAKRVRTIWYYLRHDLESPRVITYQFIRNAYKKFCRYREEDFRWLSAWKRFYKATGLSKEDLYFPYEFFKFKGARKRALYKRVRKIRNARDVWSLVHYNQLGLVQHSIIADDYNWVWWWFPRFYYFFVDRFSVTSWRLPTLRESRFYSFGYYSLFNSWRYLFAYTNRTAFASMNHAGMWPFYHWVDKTWDEFWEEDDRSAFNDDSLHNKYEKHHYVRSKPWHMKTYKEGSASFYSAFLYEQRIFSRIYLRYYPRSFVRGGNFLFYKFYRRELAYRFWFEVLVRRSQIQYIRMEPFGFFFLRDLETRAFDAMYQTVINKYAYMDFVYARRRLKMWNELWHSVDWPIYPYDEINLRHAKPWSGPTYKPAYWSIIGRFPFYRYERLGYRHYNFIGLSGQRRRWMHRHVVPFFLD